MQELTPLTGYLATAAAVLPPQDPWRTQMDTMRSEWRAKLMDPAARNAADFRQKINRALSKVKDDYRTAYFNLHKKARLGVNEDGKKEGTAERPEAGKLEEADQVYRCCRIQLSLNFRPGWQSSNRASRWSRMI